LLPCHGRDLDDPFCWDVRKTKSASDLLAPADLRQTKQSLPRSSSAKSFVSNKDPADCPGVCAPTKLWEHRSLGTRRQRHLRPSGEHRHEKTSTHLSYSPLPAHFQLVASRRRGQRKAFDRLSARPRNAPRFPRLAIRLFGIAGSVTALDSNTGCAGACRRRYSRKYAQKLRTGPETKAPSSLRLRFTKTRSQKLTSVVTSPTAGSSR